MKRPAKPVKQLGNGYLRHHVTSRDLTSPNPLATHRYTLLCADVDADISLDTKSCQAKRLAIQPTARPSRCSPALVCHECFQSHSMLNNWQKKHTAKVPADLCQIRDTGSIWITLGRIKLPFNTHPFFHRQVHTIRQGNSLVAMISTPVIPGTSRTSPSTPGSLARELMSHGAWCGAWWPRKVIRKSHPFTTCEAEVDGMLKLMVKTHIKRTLLTLNSKQVTQS